MEMLSFEARRGTPIRPHQAPSSVWGNCKELGASLSLLLLDDCGAFSASVLLVCNVHTGQAPALQDAFGWPHGGDEVTPPRWSFSSHPQVTEAWRATTRKEVAFSPFLLPFFLLLHPYC